MPRSKEAQDAANKLLGGVGGTGGGAPIPGGTGISRGFGIPTAQAQPVGSGPSNPVFAANNDPQSPLQPVQPQQPGTLPPEVDPLSLIPTQMLQQLVAQGFNEAGIRDLIARAGENFITPLDAVQGQIAAFQNQQIQQQKLEPQDPRQFNQTFDDQIIKSITEGGDAGFKKAIALRQFQQQPSDLQSLQAAIDLSQAPADIATLSAILDGISPIPNATLGNVQSLPRSPILQQAAQNLFGQQDSLASLQSAFGQTALDNQTGPITSAALEQIPINTQVQPEVRHLQNTGTQPFGSNQDPNGLNFGLNPRPTPRADELFGNFSQGVSPFLTDRFSPDEIDFNRPVPVPRDNSFPQSGPTNFAGMQRPTPPFSFPSQPGFEPIDMLPDVQQFAPPPAPGTFTPGQQQTISGNQDFSLRPSQGGPLINAGTPVGSINLEGNQQEIPSFLSNLFAGVQGGTTIDKPQSALGFAGIPLPSNQAFSRLGPDRQAEFFKFARSRGISDAQIQSELQGRTLANPGQTRFRTASQR